MTEPSKSIHVMEFASGDAFGDRMKEYEAAETGRVWDGSLPIYARLDGRSFSRFTKGMRRPFDRRMTASMVAATAHLVAETNARIGYTQSDEISLVWLFDAPGSEPLFGGKVHKLTSVLSAMATAAFNAALPQHFGEEGEALARHLAHFDARVFELPSKIEAANVFLWRSMDAKKNAVSMAARAMYSHKELHGADQARMREMLADKGVKFDEYPSQFKWGTWVQRVNYTRPFTADELDRIPEAHRPPSGQLVTRSEVREVDMPEFRAVANRVEVIFDRATPCSPPPLNKG